MKDCAIYVFDKSSDINFDSLEMKILIAATVSNEIDADKLYEEISIKTNCNLSKDNLFNIIYQNYIINYNIGISFSNPRALLQGGTGLYFGFGLHANTLQRRGNNTIKSICAKFVIPHKNKAQIRNQLRTYGICKEILYNEPKKQYNNLRYTTTVKLDNRIVKKAFVNVQISDIFFCETDIYKITAEIYKNTKIVYGKNTRIYMYIYYDKEDARSYNWIARPVPNENCNGFKLNFNSDYFNKRMIYYNEEISINTIYNITEPIVKDCIKVLNDIVKIHDSYFSNIITVDKYLIDLMTAKQAIFRKVYFDL